MFIFTRLRMALGKSLLSIVTIGLVFENLTLMLSEEWKS